MIECFVVVCYLEMPVACRLVVYTCFSVVEVDLTFNSDSSPVGMDLIDLVHIIYTLDDWKCAPFGNGI